MRTRRSIEKQRITKNKKVNKDRRYAENRPKSENHDPICLMCVCVCVFESFLKKIQLW